MLVYWIWLTLRKGMGDGMRLQLLQRFQTPEAIFFAESRDFDRVEGLAAGGRKSLLERDLAPARKILEQCAEKNLRILTFSDAAYPRRLKNIPDPPMVLYYKGTLPAFDELPVIGLVGTRRASDYGLHIAGQMGEQISRCGGVVVSGMAEGIDSEAMSGVLNAGGLTVGVLGCGADMVYPASAKELYRAVEEKGCILSEFPPGTPPVKWNFPKRNRIISGLSCGVLVVEAPEKSGALITAREALEQGRDVFVVPGNINLPTCAGSNRLLREGAAVVTEGWDVMEEYLGFFPDKIRRAEELPAGQGQKQFHACRLKQEKNLPQTGKKKSLQKDFRKKAIDKAASSPYSDVNTAITGLTEEEKKIVLCLTAGERLVDDVVAETGLTTGKVLAALTMLELKGVLKRLEGKRITLK